ncbi:AAA family ATPase [Asticcacaulis biprosthecium]|nr:AAA family ATPase [Asticcacaulis biprosthecium]
MSSIYISQIQLKEFRNFGDLTIDLPAAPGVMIVHGTNGLGKSSLFDGLEWALTGEIDHFNEWKKGAKPKDYLRRWDAPAQNPTEISLAFSDGNSLRRILPNTLDVKAGIDDVTGFLRDENWKQKIDSLHRYLLLTHFLGQSTLSRMTHRKPEERWEFLEQPAQSEWATELINTIHGQGNTNNAKAYDRRIDAWTDQLDILQDLLDREASEWADAQGQGALDDNAAYVVIESITRALPSVYDSGNASLESPGIDVLIDRIAAGEVIISGFVSSRAANMERARAILEQISTQDSHDRDSSLVIEASRNNLEPYRLASTDRKSEQASAESKVRAHEDAIKNQKEKLDELRLIRTQHSQIEQWNTELTGATAQTSQIQSEIAEAKTSAEYHSKRRSIIQNLDLRVAECNRQLAEQRELRLKAEQLLKLMPASFYVEKIGTLQQSSTAASGLIADFDLSLEALQTQTRQGEQELEAARLTFDNITGAVAKIAEKLTKSDCECPVCASTFDPNGELQRRAFEAVERLAPTLVPFQDRLSELRRKETELKQKKVEALVEIASYGSQIADFNRDLAQRNEIVGSIFGTAQEEPIETVLERISVAVDRLSSRAEQLDRRRKLPVLVTDGDAFDAWTAAIRRQNALEANLASLVRDITSLEGRVEAEKNAIEATTQALGAEADLGALIADAELALTSQTQELVSARQALDAAVQAASQASLVLAQTEASLQAMIEEVERGRNLIKSLADEWRSMDYLGDAINSEALRSQAQMLAELSAALELVRPQIVRLRDGRRIWARQSSHRETIERLRERLTAAPNLERAGLRQEAERVIGVCQKRILDIGRAKEIAQNATTEVNRKVQEFNADFLKPLSALMNKLNRAILSEPDIGLDLKVEKKKIAQTAIKSADAPDFVSKLNPQLVHSEGQMAALAVSMLCAANLSFPWCRWPALVMDDPLQHNDVIHAAAFADIMCNLVEARGHQVFLSTHDIAQAEFLRRKFSSRNIPCTSVHLLGRGRDGLEVQVKGYDSGSGRQASAVTN